MLKVKGSWPHTPTDGSLPCSTLATHSPLRLRDLSIQHLQRTKIIL